MDERVEKMGQVSQLVTGQQVDWSPCTAVYCPWPSVHPTTVLHHPLAALPPWPPGQILLLRSYRSYDRSPITIPAPQHKGLPKLS